MDHIYFVLKKAPDKQKIKMLDKNKIKSNMNRSNLDEKIE